MNDTLFTSREHLPVDDVIAARFDPAATPSMFPEPPANAYRDFLDRKAKQAAGDGFEPLWIPPAMKDFQVCLLEYGLRMGRAATFADCGLGKTLIELVYGENVVRKTNRPFLLLAPLAVGPQTVREGEKFGIECVRSTDGKVAAGARVVVTNYERLHHFDPKDFAGVGCDESSILKNMNGATRKIVTDFMSGIRYRQLYTATAAPNDFHEVGTSSEALGYLGARDMLTKFFKEDCDRDHLAWSRKVYRLRGHAEQPFWRWVCSWARACRKPSDLGFADDGYELPPLIENEFIVRNSAARPGMLFATPAIGMREQREERRVSIERRCSAVAANVAAHDGPSVVWCHLNDEGDELERQIPGGVQVSGSMEDEEKEERLAAFGAGQVKVLITKPKIGCWGLNWQHCRNVVTFPSHSWEQYYQAVRRCWRFGQTQPVTVTVVTTEGESGVTANLKRKAEQADRMFSALVEHMAAAVAVDRGWKFDKKEEVPQWL